MGSKKPVHALIVVEQGRARITALFQDYHRIIAGEILKKS
jgi:hypothetical protein